MIGVRTALDCQFSYQIFSYWIYRYRIFSYRINVIVSSIALALTRYLSLQ
jgi:hypothetical protein